MLVCQNWFNKRSVIKDLHWLFFFFVFIRTGKRMRRWKKLKRMKQMRKMKTAEQSPKQTARKTWSTRMRAKKNEWVKKNKMPISQKGPERVIYILSFYFHAFDFIIRTKYGFTKLRDACWDAGSLAPCLVFTWSTSKGTDLMLCFFPPLLKNRTFQGRRTRHSAKWNCLHALSDQCIPALQPEFEWKDWKDHLVGFQFAYTAFQCHYMINSNRGYCMSSLTVGETAVCLCPVYSNLTL